jgi:hypothetical protein
LSLFLIAILFSLPVKAATISYYLDQNNEGLPAANYAQVTISDGTGPNIGDINFQVDVLTAAFSNPGDNFGMDKFYFNYDSSLTVDTGNINNIDPNTWSVSADKNAGGGFGKFEFELKGTGASRVTTLLFSIVDVVGDEPADYAVGNPDGNPPAIEFFAAHIGGFFDPDTGAGSAKFAGSKVVPIPGSVLLLSSGLLGVIFLRRKRSVK